MQVARCRTLLNILSYPVFLYYAGSPKVPPRVFGPLGPKEGQKAEGHPAGANMLLNRPHSIS